MEKKTSMTVLTITVVMLVCDACQNKWHGRNGKLPAVCPKCKSSAWNRDGKFAIEK